MDRLSTGQLRCIEHGRLIQITLPRCGRTDAQRFVCLLYITGIAIRFGIHRDRTQAQALAGALYAQGDFAAIGDQHFIEHQKPLIGEPARRSARQLKTITQC